MSKYISSSVNSLITTERVSRAYGRVLREYREARGLSQRALAARSGVSSPAIAKIEKGQRVPSMTTHLRLSRALRVKATVFLAEVEKAFPISLPLPLSPPSTSRMVMIW